MLECRINCGLALHLVTVRLGKVVLREQANIICQDCRVDWEFIRDIAKSRKYQGRDDPSLSKAYSTKQARLKPKQKPDGSRKPNASPCRLRTIPS